MAANSSGRPELSVGKKWSDGEANPERTRVWVQHRSSSDRKVVSVVYYLCRSGQLEHPHFMEVPLSSLRGLFLRDVINRLDFLRGSGMGHLYSWASKRSYRNGFVWQDLSESDIIHPVHGHEYVLKGSELLESRPSFRSCRQLPPIPTHDSNCSDKACESPVISRRRNQSWDSFDPGNYKACGAEPDAGKSTDAATQTDGGRLLRATREDGEEAERGPDGGGTAEMSLEEISPPPSSSSTEASDTAGGGGTVGRSADIRDLSDGGDRPSGRMKASAVLMQLISCVSGSVKPGDPTAGRDRKLAGCAEYGGTVHRDACD